MSSTTARTWLTGSSHINVSRRNDIGKVQQELNGTAGRGFLPNEIHSPQTGHWKGFSSVCRDMVWNLSWQLVPKPFAQMLHRKGFTSVCVVWCLKTQKGQPLTTSTVLFVFLLFRPCAVKQSGMPSESHCHRCCHHVCRTPFPHYPQTQPNPNSTMDGNGHIALTLVQQPCLFSTGLAEKSSLCFAKPVNWLRVTEFYSGTSIVLLSFHWSKTLQSKWLVVILPVEIGSLDKPFATLPALVGPLSCVNHHVLSQVILCLKPLGANVALVALK